MPHCSAQYGQCVSTASSGGCGHAVRLLCKMPAHRACQAANRRKAAVLLVKSPAIGADAGESGSRPRRGRECRPHCREVPTEMLRFADSDGVSRGRRAPRRWISAGREAGFGASPQMFRRRRNAATYLVAMSSRLTRCTLGPARTRESRHFRGLYKLHWTISSRPDVLQRQIAIAANGQSRCKRLAAPGPTGALAVACNTSRASHAASAANGLRRASGRRQSGAPLNSRRRFVKVSTAALGAALLPSGRVWASERPKCRR